MGVASWYDAKPYIHKTALGLFPTRARCICQPSRNTYALTKYCKGFLSMAATSRAQFLLTVWRQAGDVWVRRETRRYIREPIGGQAMLRYPESSWLMSEEQAHQDESGCNLDTLSQSPSSNSTVTLMGRPTIIACAEGTCETRRTTTRCPLRDFLPSPVSTNKPVGHDLTRH